MALTVPKDDKIYTTKYANFRGVDYTNDPSNVWYRRSPDGVNMLPSLDGQPFKRNGWKVEITPLEFCMATGMTKAQAETYLSNNVFEQYKVDYFELGGTEYLFFYTSLGVFYYTDELTFIDCSWELPDPYDSASDEGPYYYEKWGIYSEGDFCRRWANGVPDSTMKYYKAKTDIGTVSVPPEAFDAAHWDEVTEADLYKPFPPTDRETGEPANIDYSKSFFFEGGGRAAYYLFANSKMYWFDGEKLHEAHPTIPDVLIVCEPNGAGTVNQDVNLLTEYRGITYACDGSTKTFVIPDGYDTTVVNNTEYPTGIHQVYIRKANGDWREISSWQMGTNPGEIEMTAAPTVVIAGGDNLRIVYKPAGATISEQQKNTSSSNLVVLKTTETKQKQTYTKKDGWKNSGSASSSAWYNSMSSPVFSVISPKKPLSDNMTPQYKDTTWHDDKTNLYLDTKSYGSRVGIECFDENCFKKYTNIKATSKTTTKYVKSSSTVRYKYTTTTQTKTIPVRISYTQWLYSTNKSGEHRDAFYASSKALVFGNGVINQAFLTASTESKYSTRVWYSMATNPMYFPDTNYMEVGATDKPIMGLIKVGEYLGVVKQGGSTDTSIYLAYATSFDDATTYAVKQSVNGVGAISNGAFNILNDEPLFLSAEGIMGIEPAEDDQRQLRNRSYYINKKLQEEPGIEGAFSFVYKGMYWLGINNHCYVLDGSQKSSWENTKTNLQYECYYLDNIPARCFARKDDKLWFIDKIGNVCRFRDDDDEYRFVDAYDADALNDEYSVLVKSYAAPVDGVFDYSDLGEIKRYGKTWRFAYDENTTLQDWYANGLDIQITGYDNVQDCSLVSMYTDIIKCDGTWKTDEILRIVDGYTITQVGVDYYISIPAGNDVFKPLDIPEGWQIDRPYLWFYASLYTIVQTVTEPLQVGTIIQYGTQFYTVMEPGETSAKAVEGVPIKARWSTIADDDGSAHYYKNLQKKGSIVALMPMSDNGVRVKLIRDEQDPILVGETEVGSHVLPFNYYLKKKVKKYKHLQIVCENDTYNCGFGVDEIIKQYTLGSYAKK